MRKLIKYLSVVGLTLLLIIFIKGDTNIMESSPFDRFAMIAFTALFIILTAVITKDID